MNFPRRPAILDADLPRGPVLAGTVGLTLLIGLGDYLTGPYLVFATFYLLPVAAAAWYTGRRGALLVGLVAAGAGMTSTALDPGSVTSPVIAWNGMFRFITYAVTALLVCAEHDTLRQVRALASTDPLTGLLNRRRFYERGDQLVALAARRGTPVALLYLDLDGLKARNDAEGHEAGDRMIRELAEIARDQLRSSDLLARVGGDEFAFLLLDDDLAAAEATAERLLGALAEIPDEPIRASVGVVAGVPVDEGGVDRLLRAGDRLMYEAKSGGRGRVRSGTLPPRHGVAVAGEPTGPPARPS